MYCNKCGKEILDNSQYCQYCGNEIKVNGQSESQQCNRKQGKVIIHSYEEFFIINPNVDIYIDGNLITSISKGQTFEYDIIKTTTITFKSSIRTAKVTVSPNAITEIRLIWNRFLGNLETVCNEQNFNGVNNYVNQQTYQGQLNSKKQSSAVVLVLALILGGILLWIYLIKH